MSRLGRGQRRVSCNIHWALFHVCVSSNVPSNLVAQCDTLGFQDVRCALIDVLGKETSEAAELFIANLLIGIGKLYRAPLLILVVAA
jgi:hypothetical protein